MSKNFIEIFTENNFIFIVDENKIIFSLTRQRSVGKRRLSVKQTMKYYFTLTSLFHCLFLGGVTHTPPSPARRLDTLHVVLSGQPNATSKPKGLHTGFSGPPRIAVKGGPSYI